MMSEGPAPPRFRARRHRGHRIAAALLPLLLLAGCKAAAPGIEARPAMWLIEDADTRIYLLGTMHALPAGTDWNRGKVAAAVDAADELMLELSPAELAKAGAMFQALAPRDAPLAMDRRLPPAALAVYRRIEGSGDFGGDRLDDWALLVLMGQRVAEEANLSPADGVESGLTAAFRDAGKPVSGLESARSQLMAFETLDPRAQRALLVAALANADHAVRDVRAMAADWSRGDAEALARIINEDVDAVPAARKAILTDRSRRWTAWAKRRMEQPGTVLLAVGAGHLVGNDGVPAMLEADGLTVTRVQ